MRKRRASSESSSDSDKITASPTAVKVQEYSKTNLADVTHPTKKIGNVKLSNFKTKIISDEYCTDDSDSEEEESDSSIDVENRDTDERSIRDKGFGVEVGPCESDICFGIIDEDETNPFVENVVNDVTKSENVEDRLVLDIAGNESDELPPGWIMKYHKTGVPIYFHETSGVCTLSKPYYLGTEYVKTHIISKSSIPCMKFFCKEENQFNYSGGFSWNTYVQNCSPESVCKKLGENTKSTGSKTEGEIPCEGQATGTKFYDNTDSNKQTTDERRYSRMRRRNKISRYLNEDVYNYYNRLFTFRKIKYMQFKSWDVRRTYSRFLKVEKNKNRYGGSGLKVVSFPIYKWDAEKQEFVSDSWVINPKERSFIAILHEYLQQSLKTAPTYKFQELENAKTPYSATVFINNTEYGVGVGKSKKEAKIIAAKNTMEVLLPQFQNIIEMAYESSMRPSELEIRPLEMESDFSVFDNISITDPQIPLISKCTSYFTPYEILEVYLQGKHHDNSKRVNIEYMVDGDKCTMSIGDHSVTVSCNNKRDGKQKAAQALLQQLHPYLSNWGSLLRLYGNENAMNKQCHTQISNSVDEDLMEYTDYGPNPALISTLQKRMLALKKKLEGSSTSEISTGYDLSNDSTIDDHSVNHQEVIDGSISDSTDECDSCISTSENSNFSTENKSAKDELKDIFRKAKKYTCVRYK